LLLAFSSPKYFVIAEPASAISMPLAIVVLMTLKAAFATINSANISTISLHSFGVARTVFQMVALSNSLALGILLEVQLHSLDHVVLG
jgi:hypothetical protein